MTQYLRMPKAMVRAWVVGQAGFKPVLRAALESGVPLLSFVNLV